MGALTVTAEVNGNRARGVAIRTDTPLPPPAGPFREHVLRDQGEAALRACKRRYRLALLVVNSARPEDVSGPPADADVRTTTGLAGFPPQVGPELGMSAARASLPGEADARSALRHAVDALNLLEDTDLEPTAHEWVHRAGAFVGREFGCADVLDDEGVRWNECPVDLAHVREGLSVAFTAVRLCSICRTDFSECPHLPDVRYPIVASTRDGVCSVCGLPDCAAHEPGSTYSVMPSALVEEVDSLHEVSVVSRPRDPLARWNAIEVRAERAAIGVVRLDCTRCLQSCAGYRTMFTPRLD